MPRKGRKEERVRACTECGYLTSASACPNCGSTSFSERWMGLLVVITPDSQVAAVKGVSKPGRYALTVL